MVIMNQVSMNEGEVRGKKGKVGERRKRKGGEEKERVEGKND